MNEPIHITTERSKVEAMSAISELPDDGSYEVIIKKTAKDRTGKQNRSLHLYLGMMSKKFNDAGIDQKMACQSFKEGFSIPVTEVFLKQVFQAVAFDMYQKKHTSELTTVEMIKIYDAYNAAMGDRFGVSCLWPVKEDKP